MKSPFSKLPEEGLKWLLVASSRTDKNYKEFFGAKKSVTAHLTLWAIRKEPKP